MKIRLQNTPDSFPVVVAEFEAGKRETLLAIMGRVGFPVTAPCGGKQRCGKCKVKIIEGRVKDAFTSELLLGEVLACRAVPETDLTLALISESVYEAGEYDQIKANNGAVRFSRAAVALAIGTTTVSARLVDLDTGIEPDTYSALNRQRVYGADVMSRIGAAREGKTAELFSLINRQTEEILSGFIKKFSLKSIETLAVAANTTMLHLFANEDPSAMGEIPFTPRFLEGREYSGKDLSLPVDRVTLFPSVSAFIGGDIVSGLGEIDVLKAGEAVFFIDIGTNGEMALFHDGKLFCTSAAAGPALEGAEISCGVGSVRGAINKVQLFDSKVHFNTIGGEAPIGICGCGLIDAMAL
ncbi:MAG: ASKHA domain-containing protein, partial [Treponema sp.]|nr:ASKHA domain-containing protein [Treponema sp.]